MGDPTNNSCQSFTPDCSRRICHLLFDRTSLHHHLCRRHLILLPQDPQTPSLPVSTFPLMKCMILIDSSSFANKVNYVQIFHSAPFLLHVVILCCPGSRFRLGLRRTRKAANHSVSCLLLDILTISQLDGETAFTGAMFNGGYRNVWLRPQIGPVWYPFRISDWSIPCPGLLIVTHNRTMATTITTLPPTS